MADDALDPGLFAPLPEARDRLGRVVRRSPHPRALGEHLHRVASDRLGPVDRLPDAAGRRDVSAEEHAPTLPAMNARLSPLALGPLAERDYRLLFSATTVTTLGDRAGRDRARIRRARRRHGRRARHRPRRSAGRRGRSCSSSAPCSVDRVPRNLVLVGASLVQATAQAGTGALVLSGHASIAKIAALQALYGLGQGFVVAGRDRARAGDREPSAAAAGQCVPGALTQHDRRCSALPSAARSSSPVAPGSHFVVDAASFLVAAVILSRIRLATSGSADGRAAVSQLARGRAGGSSSHRRGCGPPSLCFSVDDVRLRRLARARAGRRERSARWSGSLGRDPRARREPARSSAGLVALRVSARGGRSSPRSWRVLFMTPEIGNAWPSERRCG